MDALYVKWARMYNARKGKIMQQWRKDCPIDHTSPDYEHQRDHPPLNMPLRNWNKFIDVLYTMDLKAALVRNTANAMIDNA